MDSRIVQCVNGVKCILIYVALLFPLDGADDNDDDNTRVCYVCVCYVCVCYGPLKDFPSERSFSFRGKMAPTSQIAFLISPL